MYIFTKEFWKELIMQIFVSTTLIIIFFTSVIYFKGWGKYLFFALRFLKPDVIYLYDTYLSTIVNKINFYIAEIRHFNIMFKVHHSEYISYIDYLRNTTFIKIKNFSMTFMEFYVIIILIMYLLSLTIWARAAGPRVRLDQLNIYTFRKATPMIILTAFVALIIYFLLG